MEMNDRPYFGFAVFASQCAIPPLTAMLTYDEIVLGRIRLETRDWSLYLPDQTIVHPRGFIPLYLLNNCLCCPSLFLNSIGIYHIMVGFGADANDCYDITYAINQALMWPISEGKGVGEVKIWKITAKVYDFDRVSENLLIERYELDESRAIGLLRKNSNGPEGCVICMEDYIEGSIVVKLPCDHDFHGVCINQWSQIKRRCPLCRTQIPPLSSLSFFLCILEL